MIRIAFIGDVVGRPGRGMLKEHLQNLKNKESIDFVIANGENASHGFGINRKNANELLSSGVDFLTGGNHSWDQKDMISMLEDMPVIRPINYPDEVPGVGVKVLHVRDEKIAIINTLGHYGMPMVENPFKKTEACVEELLSKSVKNIFIDFHAESTAEKRGLHIMLKGRVSAIFGTHTHIGTDDLTVEDGTCYVSDVGLSGCRDNIIGSKSDAPLKRMTTGLPASFDIPTSCKRLMQVIICEVEDGVCKKAKKVRIFDGQKTKEDEAIYE